MVKSNQAPRTHCADQRKPDALLTNGQLLPAASASEECAEQLEGAVASGQGVNCGVPSFACTRHLIVTVCTCQHASHERTGLTQVLLCQFDEAAVET